MSRGGKRVGAGRPAGFGKYGPGETKQIRVPVARLAEIYAFLETDRPISGLPMYSSKIQAGFPSAADDHIEGYLDLNTAFIKHPAATFFLRATGDSMIEAGISAGDILVVDRSLEAQDGKIVIAAVDGELTVKRLTRKEGRVFLSPANPKYRPIEITDNQDLVIWGVVTLVLHEPS